MSSNSHIQEKISTYLDDQGRPFHYVFIKKSDSPLLVVHFTAFFGDWGDNKEFKTNYQGYFHRYRMLKDESFNVLFLCDQFGATKNGTYYTGELGDLFVERAMNHIISDALRELSFTGSQMITVGSSMGAFAALKFGLIHQAKGIISICPHIDLDTSAKFQGRELHVAATLKDGLVYADHNKAITHQVSNLVENLKPELRLPRLFMHSCRDDVGVHNEQVIPFVDLWKRQGGVVDFDEREYGGHGSDYCTKAVILDVIEKINSNRATDVALYQKNKRYLPKSESKFKRRLIGVAKRLLRRM